MLQMAGSFEQYTPSLQDPSFYNIEKYDANFVDETLKQRSQDLTYEDEIQQLSVQQIKMLQRKLVEAGYDLSYVGMRPGIAGIDGDPGTKTLTAIKRYVERLRTGTPIKILEKEHMQLDTYRYEKDTATSDSKEELAGLAQDITGVRIEHTRDTFQEYLESGDFAKTQLLPSGRKKMTAEAMQTVAQVSDIYRTQQPPFDYVTLADTRGLIWYESYFRQDNPSSTGSQGVMQLTSISFGQFKQTPERFNTAYLKAAFAREGLDYERIVARLQKKKGTNSKGKTYGYYAFGYGSREEVFDNKKINITLGMAYLKRCEDAGMFGSAKRVIQESSHTLTTRATDMIKGRGVRVDTKKMEDLRQKLVDDPYLQRKFATFARYNGEEDYTDGKTVQDRFVYAMSVLYMGTYTF